MASLPSFRTTAKGPFSFAQCGIFKILLSPKFFCEIKFANFEWSKIFISVIFLNLKCQKFQFLQFCRIRNVKNCNFHIFRCKEIRFRWIFHEMYSPKNHFLVLQILQKWFWQKIQVTEKFFNFHAVFCKRKVRL